jgi:hypothetical protein
MLGLINQLAIARASGGVGGARGLRQIGVYLDVHFINNIFLMISFFILLALFQIIENSAFSNAGIIL